MLILLVLASIKIASVTMIFFALLNLEVHLFLLSLPRSRSAPTNGGSSTLIGLTSQIDAQASSLAEMEVTYTVCCIISLGEISGNLGILLEVDVSRGFGILLDFVLCLRLSITLRSSCNFFVETINIIRPLTCLVTLVLVGCTDQNLTIFCPFHLP